MSGSDPRFYDSSHAMPILPPPTTTNSTSSLQPSRRLNENAMPFDPFSQTAPPFYGLPSTQAPTFYSHPVPPAPVWNPHSLPPDVSPPQPDHQRNMLPSRSIGATSMNRGNPKEQKLFFPTNFGKFLDDISNVRLSAEKRIHAASNLQTALAQLSKGQSNSANNLLESLSPILFESHDLNVNLSVARCIGGLAVLQPRSVLDWIQAHFLPSLPLHHSIPIILALSVALDGGSPAVFAPFIMATLTTIRQFLENCHDAEPLGPLVPVLIHICKTYPSIFSLLFQDIVDFLLGWLVAEIPGSLVESIFELFHSCGSIWLTKIDFVCKLLGHMIDALEGLRREMPSSGSRVPLIVSPSDAYMKKDALPTSFNSQPTIVSIFDSDESSSALNPFYMKMLGYFRGLCGLLGSLAPPAHVPIQTLFPPYFLENVLKRVSSLVSDLPASSYSEPWTGFASKTLAMLAALLGVYISHFAVPITAFYMKLLVPLPSTSRLLSWLQELYVILECAGDSLPVPAISALISPTSPFPASLIHPNSPQLSSGLVSLYSLLLKSRSIAIVEAVYAHLRDTMDRSLSSSCSLFDQLSKQELKIPASNLMSLSSQMEILDLIVVTCSTSLRAICELAFADPHFISIKILKPPLLDTILGLLNRDRAMRSHLVTHSLLRLLFSFVKCTGYFARIPKSQAPIDIRHVLTSISQLLPSLDSENADFCLTWVMEVASELKEMADLNIYVQPVSLEGWCALVEAIGNLAQSLDSPVRIKVAECFIILYSLDIVPVKSIRRCFPSVLPRIYDVEHDVREAFIRVLSSLPLGALGGCPDLCNTASLALWRTRIMSLSSPLFRAPQLQTVLCSLIDDVFASKSPSPRRSLSLASEESDPRYPPWLAPLALFCQFNSLVQGSSPSAEGPLFTDRLLSSDLLLFWAVNEASAFTVSSKLRTPLGKAGDTFETLEKLFRNISASMIENILPRSSAAVSHQAVSSLLRFIYLFEKHCYNAFQGCISLPPLSLKSARLFFRTNRTICDDWFSKTKASTQPMSHLCGEVVSGTMIGLDALEMIVASLKAGSKDQALLLSQLDKTLLDIVSALIIARDADLLRGLMAWFKTLTYQKFSSAGGAKHVLKRGEANLLDLLGAAVFEAEGNLESAAKAYSVLFNAVVEKPREKDSLAQSQLVLEFASSHVVNCYSQLSAWDLLFPWINRMATLKDKVDPDLQQALTLKENASFLSSLRCFDDNKLQQAESHFSNCPASSLPSPPAKSWSVWQNLETADHHILGALLSMHDDNENMKAHHIGAAVDMLSDALKTFLLDCKTAAINASISLGLISALSCKGDSRMVSSILNPDVLSTHIDSMNVASITKIHRIAHFLTTVGASAVSLSHLERLRLILSRQSRKLGNLTLASTIIGQCTIDSLEVQYEKAKQMASLSSIESAFEELLSILPVASRTQHDERVRLFSFPGKGPLSSRVLIRLARWVTHVHSPALLGKIDAALRVFGENPHHVIHGAVNYENLEEGDLVGLPLAQSELAGRCLLVSALHDPHYGRAKLKFADWCYEQGTEMQKRIGNPDEELTQLLKGSFPSVTEFEEKKNLLIAAMSLPVGPTASGELDIGSSMATPLEKIESLFPDSPELVAASLRQWTSRREMLVYFFNLSLEGYFDFLRLGSGRLGHPFPSESHLREDFALVHDDKTVHSALRVLRVFSGFGPELEAVVSKGFDLIPAPRWEKIVPQLFAQLSHLSSCVVAQVTKLLARLARSSRHLIAYPAVVGLRAESPGPMGTKSPFALIVAALNETDAHLVSTIGLLIEELQRITVLWEERWLDAYLQRQNDISRRLNRLKDETARVFNNDSLDPDEKRRLVFEKHTAILKPVLVAMEKLRSETYEDHISTVHEQWFVDTFRTRIDHAIDELKTPSFSPYSPEASWAPFKAIFEELKELGQTKSHQILSLRNLSSRLPSLSNTSMFMPGVPISAGSDMITIVSFDDLVSVLSTKTKPKKMSLLGSDGKKYTYLFKGTEDLHLDERIMQFLDIVNDILIGVSTAELRSERLRARHYSVIPLGARSGLIQWVDGAVPAFSLYRHWQQREFAALKEKLEADPSFASSAPPLVSPQRPKDLFYGKITPLLRERGLSSASSRSKWPKDILKQAFAELSRETPADLLQRELWIIGSSGAEWSTLVRSYTSSMAVMSMVGYVIGLGDRHLDNILLDVSSGEVVHIDYNVCFEKGQKLRIPETVPFRLTQNFAHALGITGVDGLFRIICERVMGCLRDHRETLLALLEAFVYDPLMDWTPDLKIVQEQQAMELGISSSLLAARVSELRSSITDMRDRLLSNVNLLQDSIDGAISLIRSRDLLAGQIDSFQRELAFLRILQHNNYSSSLQRLASLHEQKGAVVKECDEIMSALHKRLRELNAIVEQHHGAFQTLLSPELLSLKGDLECILQNPSRFDDSFAGLTKTYEIASPFLHASGMSAAVGQCEALRNDLAQLYLARARIMFDSLKALFSFRTIVSGYPLDAHTRTSVGLWRSAISSVFQNGVSRDALSAIATSPPHLHPAPGNIERCEELQSFILSWGEQLSGLVGSLKKSLNSISLPILIGSISDLLDNSLDFSTPSSSDAQHMALTALMLFSKLVLKETLIAEESLSSNPASYSTLAPSLQRLSNLCKSYLSIVTHVSSLSMFSGSFLDTIPCLHSYRSFVELMALLASMKIKFQHSVVPEVLGKIEMHYDHTSLGIVFSALAGFGDAARSLHGSLVQDMTSSISSKAEPAPSLLAFNDLKRQFHELLSTSMNGTVGGMVLGRLNNVFEELETLYRRIDVESLDPVLGLRTRIEHQQNEGLVSAILFVNRIMALAKLFSALWGYGRRYAHPYATSLVAEEVALPSLSSSAFPPSSEEYTALPVLGSVIETYVCDFVALRLRGVVSYHPSRFGAFFIKHLGGDVELSSLTLDALLDVLDQYSSTLDREVASKATQTFSIASNFSSKDFIEDCIRELEASAAWLKLQLARFQWLNAEVLERGKHPRTPLQPSRASVVDQLRKTVDALASNHHEIKAANEKLCQQEALISQRLKWACGGNKSLSSVSDAFTESCSRRQHHAFSEAKQSHLLFVTTNGLLQFCSFLGLTSEYSESSSLVSLIQHLIGLQKQLALFSESERSIGESLPPNALSWLPSSGFRHEWLLARSQQLPQLISAMASELEQLSNSFPEQVDIIKESRAAVSQTFAVLDKLLSDELRPLLEELLKANDTNARNTMNLLDVPSSVWGQHVFALTSVVDGPSLFFSSADAKVKVLLNLESCSAVTPSLLSAINRMFDGVLSLQYSMNQRDEVEESSQPRDLVCEPDDEPTLKPVAPAVSNKPGKNSFALSIIERIRAKLEGSDFPSETLTSSVSLQVGRILGDSTNPDHLAMLYEGWTSWI